MTVVKLQVYLTFGGKKSNVVINCRHSQAIQGESYEKMQ